MSLTYKRIPSSEVSPELVRAANEAARDAAWDLGLGKMRVQWFKPDSGEPTAGWFDERWPDVIHISERWARDNGLEQTRAAIYHECRHAWQEKPARHMRFDGYGRAGEREDDANSYAYKKTGTVLNVSNWFDNRKYY